MKKSLREKATKVVSSNILTQSTHPTCSFPTPQLQLIRWKNWSTDHTLLFPDLATLLYLDTINRPTGPLFWNEGTFELHWYATRLVLVVKPEGFQTSQGTFNQQVCNFRRAPSPTRQPCLTLNRRTLNHQVVWAPNSGSFSLALCALVYLTVSQTDEKLKKHLWVKLQRHGV